MAASLSIKESVWHQINQHEERADPPPEGPSIFYFRSFFRSLRSLKFRSLSHSVPQLILEIVADEGILLGDPDTIGVN